MGWRKEAGTGSPLALQIVLAHAGKVGVSLALTQASSLFSSVTAGIDPADAS